MIDGLEEIVLKAKACTIREIVTGFDAEID
jgi:hypothetical protein